MGCAQSTKQNKYQSNKKQNKQQKNVSKPQNITQEFVQKAKIQGISVEKVLIVDPTPSELPTREHKNKTFSHPNLLQNIEILHKHMYPKLKPLSCNSLFKNRQNLGLCVHDQRSTIASLQPHKSGAYFNDCYQTKEFIEEPNPRKDILQIPNC
ncbi:hypothetical protein TTHERM_00149130 (macronuclear) [Tetrahymena thermophila SB210]|uniref:Uncharacterized protein n=1 Tax=Tetrahymena thermophila (strain SB210) TaxID=312017 RepID=I7ML73_TETTS|nr:hypothetical protein TTHERM_00149130 [Tetrahymena thermophila SB210]EAS01303.1 hypothetical protein TTHERM_00149130 [Tetrahymena thermophila SB210]|eukprot:XP_001021548.1 hypothetical protein TTHERM_00149130 [Tetrahymena thermophila SB210]